MDFSLSFPRHGTRGILGINNGSRDCSCIVCTSCQCRSQHDKIIQERFLQIILLDDFLTFSIVFLEIPVTSTSESCFGIFILRTHGFTSGFKKLSCMTSEFYFIFNIMFEIFSNHGMIQHLVVVNKILSTPIFFMNLRFQADSKINIQDFLSW